MDGWMDGDENRDVRLDYIVIVNRVDRGTFR